MTECKILIIISLILLVLLIFILIREHYPQRIINRLYNRKSNDLTLRRIRYQNATNLYRYYHKQGNIVMLGNSITHRVNWNELLNRNDIINRGIDNDITEGFLNRIDNVIKINPKICFIMGGINDITDGTSPLIINSNIAKLIKKLKNAKIDPVIFSILYVADTFPNYSYVNKKVKEANELIKENCKKSNVTFIDLNNKLGNNYILKEEFSLDGLHLTGIAYQKWGEIIANYLENKN